MGYKCSNDWFGSGLGKKEKKNGGKHAGFVSWKEPKTKKIKSIDWFGINYERNIEKIGCKNTVKKY